MAENSNGIEIEALTLISYPRDRRKKCVFSAVASATHVPFSLSLIQRLVSECLAFPGLSFQRNVLHVNFAAFGFLLHPIHFKWLQVPSKYFVFTSKRWTGMWNICSVGNCAMTNGLVSWNRWNSREHEDLKAHTNSSQNRNFNAIIRYKHYFVLFSIIAPIKSLGVEFVRGKDILSISVTFEWNSRAKSTQIQIGRYIFYIWISIKQKFWGSLWWRTVVFYTNQRNKKKNNINTNLNTMANKHIYRVCGKTAEKKMENDKIFSFDRIHLTNLLLWNKRKASSTWYKTREGKEEEEEAKEKN